MQEMLWKLGQSYIKSIKDFAARSWIRQEENSKVHCLPRVLHETMGV